MVNSTPASARRTSTSAPSRCRWSICAGVYGLLTRGSSCTRRTVLAKSSVTTGLGGPVIAAAEAGWGAAAKGMWPSPANSAESGQDRSIRRGM